MLIFDVNNSESFFNLSKWHTDALRYCKNQGDRFAIILVGIQNYQSRNTYTSSFKPKTSASLIDPDLIEKFKIEKQYVIGYKEVDLADENADKLKEPFRILLDYMCKCSDSRILSPSYTYFTSSNMNLDLNNKLSSNSNSNTLNVKHRSKEFESRYSESNDIDESNKKSNQKKCCSVM